MAEGCDLTSRSVSGLSKAFGENDPETIYISLYSIAYFAMLKDSKEGGKNSLEEVAEMYRVGLSKLEALMGKFFS